MVSGVEVQLQRVDNFVLPFHIEGTDVRGRFIRLGHPLQTILNGHGYPHAVSRLLGEAILLTALLGSGLKLRHRFTLQARGDGAIGLLVADFFADGSVRGYADFDVERLQRWTEGKGGDAVNPFLFLGKGYLALTVDQGPNTQPYQGVVELEGTSLSAAVLRYMEQSDQLLSSLRMSLTQGDPSLDMDVANNNRPVEGEWRGGAVLLQKLGNSGEEAKLALADEDAQEKWDRSRILFKTLTDEEIIDTNISPDRLLFNLFHEDGVRIYDTQPLQFGCTCSAEKVENVIKSSEREEVYAMIENGKITAKCQFCSSVYSFNPHDFGLEV